MLIVVFFYLICFLRQTMWRKDNLLVEGDRFMVAAITVNNLNVSYHGNDAIQEVSFSISSGKLVGIIGPNGAGKSTLLKALLELIPRDTGDIQLNGKSI